MAHDELRGFIMETQPCWFVSPPLDERAHKEATTRQLPGSDYIWLLWRIPAATTGGLSLERYTPAWHWSTFRSISTCMAPYSSAAPPKTLRSMSNDTCAV